MDVDASDAGDPRLILSTHRALDAIGGFVNPSDIRALHVVSKPARDSRVLAAIKRVVTQRCTALAASKRARRRLEAVDAMGRFLGPGASSTAAGALRILKSCSKSLVMDLAFVLEGQSEDALPEKILGTVEWHHFDLDPDNSPVIKVCGEDN